MNEVVDDVVDDVVKMRNGKSRNTIVTLVLVLLFGNAGLQGIDLSGAFGGEHPVTSEDFQEIKTATTETKNSVAILAGTVSNYITEQDNTKEEVVETINDLMDTINFIDIKKEINGTIRQLEGRIDRSIERKEELILEKTRSDANGNISAELDRIYTTQIRFIDMQVEMWSNEIAEKKSELEN